MSKSWSSFEGQQLLQENWRNFLSEETSAVAQRLRDRGVDTEDYWEEPEEQGGDPQASNFPDVSTGLDSDYKRDSLKQVLGRLTPPLDPAHIQALIGVIAQIAGDEGIMLELSLKGLNSEQDRIIDSAGTAQILNTIAGWNLPAKESTALIKALNYWGRVNSVKFTAPPAAAPAVANTTDPLDDTPQDTTPPDEPEPEPGLEPTAVSKDQQRRTPRIGRQIQGSGPADPDDEDILSPPTTEPEPDDREEPSADQEQVWSGSSKIGYVDATPENALQSAIQQNVPSTTNYKDFQTLIKSIEGLLKGGAGLRFIDDDTEEKTLTPKWVRSPVDDRLEIPSYTYNFMMPRSIGSWARKLKDFFSPHTAGHNTSWSGDLVSAVPPEAIKNLEDLLGKMKEEVKTLRKPEGDKQLQETYDRWQTIAGINQRVL
jgi:hypothetical protein